MAAPAMEMGLLPGARSNSLVRTTMCFASFSMGASSPR